MPGGDSGRPEILSRAVLDGSLKPLNILERASSASPTPTRTVAAWHVVKSEALARLSCSEGRFSSKRPGKSRTMDMMNGLNDAPGTDPYRAHRSTHCA